MASTARDDHADWVRSALDRHESRLIRYASRLLGDPDRALDVVQETFLRLCSQDRAELDHRLAEWLFTVCRNRALDVLKKERRMSRLDDGSLDGRAGAGPGPDRVAEDRDAAARVLDLLETLPPSQREVIRLKFQEGFSYREISQISGHSVGNVGYLIHVGLKAIRARMAGPTPHRQPG